MSDARFGPNTVAVQTVIDQVRTVTMSGISRMYRTQWFLTRRAARIVARREASRVAGSVPARSMAWNTAWDAALPATVDALWSSAWSPGTRGAIWNAIWDAILAETTRDLISEDHYNLLMAPWRAGVRASDR